MDFRELLCAAKEKDGDAVNEILRMYKPLLIKESVWNGVFDEDLYQELCVVLLRCIHAVRI